MSILYQYELNVCNKVVCKEYKIIKDTVCGYWINYHSGKKWISKTSKKKYAYAKKKDALESAMLRTEKRITILEEQMEDSKCFLRLLKEIEGCEPQLLRNRWKIASVFQGEGEIE